jgi:hypothetical protein
VAPDEAVPAERRLVPAPTTSLPDVFDFPLAVESRVDNDVKPALAVGFFMGFPASLTLTWKFSMPYR